MNGLSLCAGVGALDLGLHLAMPDYRTVGYVEREAFSAAVLVARMEDAALAKAPIWDDLSTFDGRPYRGLVDLVSSGLPCQPYSLAGKRRGHEDERALWPEFVRIVRECEPGIVFLENVPEFRKHFAPVWGELRAMGFEWAPPLLQTASESGAPHIRRRFFALAAHPDRLDGWTGTGGEDRKETGDCGSESSNAHRSRFLSEWCGWVFDSERQTLRHDTDRCGNRCRIRGTLWDAESPPVRVDARTSSRLDELRAIGNVGAPPVVYARAFLTLAGGVRSRAPDEEMR